MKKILTVIIAFALMVSCCACGQTGDKEEYERVEFNGVNITIPTSWKYDREASGTTYKLYKTDDDSTIFQMNSHGNSIVLGHKFTIYDVCESTTATYRAREGYSNVSDAEPGNFTQDYYTCTFTCDVEENGQKYYAKYCTAYLEWDTISFMIKNKDGDFSTFDEAIEGATYNSMIQPTENEDL